MKTKLALRLSVLLALMLAPAGAAMRYVNLNNPKLKIRLPTHKL